MNKQSSTLLTEFMTSKPNEEQILDFVKELAFMNNPSDRTITSRYSMFKKFLREGDFGLDPTFLKMKVNPPKSLTKKVMLENMRVRNSKKLIKFDKDFVDYIFSLRTSDNIYDNVIFLQFISGRRINEIFDADVRLDNKQPDIIKMRLSKKKDKLYYPVRLIKDAAITGKQFKKLLLDTRKKVTGLTLNEFTLRTNNRIKQLKKELTSHDLRAMYGVYLFNRENPEEQTLTGFISKVLNHDETSESGINYSNFVYI